MKNIFVILLMSFVCLQGLAQEYIETEDNGVPKGELWLGLQVAVPTGDFAASIDRNFAYGGNIGYVGSPSKKSQFFQIGADISVLYMGKDKKEIGDLRVKTTNTAFFTHLVARFRVETESFIKPYVDIMGGGKFFLTTTKYNNDVVQTLLDLENDEIFGEQSNGAWSYGTGLGFTMKKSSISLDFKVIYLRGSGLNYISPTNFFQDDNGDFFYESQEIRFSHMILPQVSVVGWLQ